MHGKGEISKIKGSICNIPTETTNMQHFTKTGSFQWIRCY